jgi:hypothetical protein
MRVSRVVAASMLLTCVSSCGASELACNQDHCAIGSHSVGAAVLAAVAASAVFAVTGCTVNGCELPYTCNEETKRCERIGCDEHDSCPGGYSCDLRSLLCI